MDNMNYIWLLLVSAVCLTLLIPADAWGVRRIIRRIRIPHPGPRWPKPGPRWPRPRPGPWLRNCEVSKSVVHSLYCSTIRYRDVVCIV